ncbi:MAG TPA: 16S rRNA (guanine(527)-N(7))-methyltransferase RsmG [Caulobacteraceae bacterium]|nr:16S rRNA (guanine(527)-N(7))-methyltransferase RsmG [Caulobacteraceae bacterium]
MTPEQFAESAGATPAQVADLERFRAMVEQTNMVMNLVGPATLPQFWSRHALDSAQLLRLEPQAKTWADLGAGAGFPGVVLAILLKDMPGAKVWLIDSLAKRCRFLSEAVAALALPAEVVNARAESLSLSVEVVTARACAPMTRLLGFAEPYFRKGARGLFLKGESAEAELNEARKSWSFDPELLPSASDLRGRVVRIRRLSRAR